MQKLDTYVNNYVGCIVLQLQYANVVFHTALTTKAVKFARDAPLEHVRVVILTALYILKLLNFDKDERYLDTHHWPCFRVDNQGRAYFFY